MMNMNDIELYFRRRSDCSVDQLKYHCGVMVCFRNFILIDPRSGGTDNLGEKIFQIHYREDGEGVEIVLDGRNKKIYSSSLQQQIEQFVSNNFKTVYYSYMVGDIGFIGTRERFVSLNESSLYGILNLLVMVKKNIDTIFGIDF